MAVIAYGNVYVCSGDATRWSRVEPLSLCTTGIGWAVPFQKPQGQLRVGACLSEAYPLRLYSDLHPIPIIEW